jgi:hypothetical protein
MLYQPFFMCVYVCADYRNKDEIAKYPSLLAEFNETRTCSTIINYAKEL